MPGAVLAPAQLLDAISLVDSAASLREIFREASPKFPLLTERARSLADLRFLAAIRRAILPNGEIGDDASPALRRMREGMARTREGLQKALERILRARGGESRRRLHHATERSLCDSRASVGAARVWTAWSMRPAPPGQTVFVEPLETIEVNNRLVQLRRRGGGGDCADPGRIDRVSWCPSGGPFAHGR